MFKLTAGWIDLRITCLYGILRWVGGPSWSRSRGAQSVPFLCSFGWGMIRNRQSGQGSSCSWSVRIFISYHGNGAGSRRGFFSDCPCQERPQARVPACVLSQWLSLLSPDGCISPFHALPWTAPRFGFGCVVELVLGSSVTVPKSFDLHSISFFALHGTSSWFCRLPLVYESQLTPPPANQTSYQSR